MAVAEFDFEALEPVAPPLPPAEQEQAAVDLLADAQLRAAAIHAEAQAEGYAAGRAEALASLEPALAALGAAVEAVRAEQVATAEALERRAVELGLALAAKVVAGALAVEPERVVDAVQGALRGIVERERITVLVNPDDMEIVSEAIEGVRASLGGIEHCVVEAERRVGRGGCIVRTPVGDVDARVETKLERAAEVVSAALGRS
ncbi:MAG TPA: FliH/SctL family protein [Solirubrobacter sp.]|nr:FliH/SctL family protein [Solirubrobacter sp.]